MIIFSSALSLNSLADAPRTEPLKREGYTAARASGCIRAHPRIGLGLTSRAAEAVSDRT